MPGRVGKWGTRPGTWRMQQILCRIGHHPAAKLFSALERPVARATSAPMNSILNEAQPAPTARRTDSLFPDSSEEESNEVKVSVSIASYDSIH